jgi:hypothetical protein
MQGGAVALVAPAFGGVLLSFVLNLYNFSRGEVIVIKYRDRTWKETLCISGRSAIEYLMPDLAAGMNPEGKIDSTSGTELFSEGSDSDKYMRVLDVLFNIPMLDGENRNVAMFAEQQHEPSAGLPEKVFESYVRIREKWRLPTTCIVIYTGSAPNVSTYTESCYGCEVSMKFRTYYLPEKSADELRADHHPFALVMLAGRLALDAGGDVKLREKYAEEIAEIVEERGYDKREKFFIINFAEKIFRVREPEMSDRVKEVYDMQMIPLEEYAEKVRLEHAKIDAMEKVARSLLADGMPLQQVAKHTELPVEDLQELVPN